MNDPDARRRWIISIALAIAINEIAIGFLRAPGEHREAAAPAVRVAMERRPRPTPAPTPRPTPTPPPPPVRVPPRATAAPVPQVAAPHAAGPKAPVHGGSVARPVTKPKLDVYTMLAQRGLGRARGVSGSGTGQGAGAGAGGGENGTGDANGSGGNGSGAVNANRPCGSVTFNIKGAPRYVAGTAYENVSATVQFPDGHSETAFFPYKWAYPDGERTDPWSSTNLREHPGDDYEIAAQLPPPGSDTSGFPSVILYILQHTGPDGRTNLGPCPNAGPPPPPPPR
ncbi:MAG: hypothetical protein ABR591_08340 [Candidatus Velthaea sp.]